MKEKCGIGGGGGVPCQPCSSPPLNTHRRVNADGPAPAFRTSCPPSQPRASGPGAHQSVPPAAPEGTWVHSWYNVTVLVKMDFSELQQVDARLLDHMRLLHSMVGEGGRGRRGWGGVPRANSECPTLKQL